MRSWGFIPPAYGHKHYLSERLSEWLLEPILEKVSQVSHLKKNGPDGPESCPDLINENNGMLWGWEYNDCGRGVRGTALSLYVSQLTTFSCSVAGRQQPELLAASCRHREQRSHNPLLCHPGGRHSSSPWHSVWPPVSWKTLYCECERNDLFGVEETAIEGEGGDTIREL